MLVAFDRVGNLMSEDGLESAEAQVPSPSNLWAEPTAPDPTVTGQTVPDPTGPVYVEDPLHTQMEPLDPWPSGSPAPKRRPQRFGLLVSLVVILGLVAGLIGGAVGYFVADHYKQAHLTEPSANLNQEGPGSSQRPSDSIAGIAQQVLPQVVSINEVSSSESGVGSGVILKSDGYILTNNHVIDAVATNGGTITVTFNNNTQAPAKIVGRDTSYDLAVIKVDKTGLPAATLGNSDNVVVGDTVIAIGSPLGFQGTVTSGIVSALNRPVTAGSNANAETSFISAIQTDAAINPGNSGGPLVNSSAAVIGINSAIASVAGQSNAQSGNIGLGFAIPINQAARVAEEIIQKGYSTRPVLGVGLDPNYDGPGARITTSTTGGVVPVTQADQAPRRACSPATSSWRWMGSP